MPLFILFFLTQAKISTWVCPLDVSVFNQVEELARTHKSFVVVFWLLTCRDRGVCIYVDVCFVSAIKFTNCTKLNHNYGALLQNTQMFLYNSKNLNYKKKSDKTHRQVSQLKSLTCIHEIYMTIICSHVKMGVFSFIIFFWVFNCFAIYFTLCCDFYAKMPQQRQNYSQHS